MSVWIQQWDLRCEKCSDGQKKFNGCDQDSDIPDRWQVREYIWLRCPVKLITRFSRECMRSYNLLQLGIQPYNLGYLQQSNRYNEAMQIIDGEVKRISMENARKMQTKG